MEAQQMDLGRKLYILANQVLPRDKQKVWEEMPVRRFWGLFPTERRSLPQNSELESLMDHFMEEISRENRMIFLRRYWYMDTVPEIAARCGRSEAQVRNRLRRTKGRLHTYLERQGVSL